jgi:Protein of unknown function (DUF3574)
VSARWILLFAGVTAVAGGCTKPGPEVMPAPAAARCEPGDTALVRDVIYFGLYRPNGGIVADAEWQAFLDSVITPRFPAGLTVVSATGQWRGKSGVVERERAEVLTVLHGGDEPSRRAVAEIAGEYRRRFSQEAVLRERVPTCARF